MKTYAIANRKGGVGKTTTAAHLAAGLSGLRQRVLLVDMGPQCHAGRFFGHNAPEGLSDVLEHGANPLSAMIEITPTLALLADHRLPETERALNKRNVFHMALQRPLEPLRDRFDYCVIDTGPNLTALAIVALWTADRVIVPVQLEALPANSLSKFVGEIAELQEQAGRDWPYTILPTMYDKRRNIHRGLLEALRETFGDKVHEPIPISTAISECPAFGQTIYKRVPYHDASIAYAKLSGVVHAG